MLQIEFWFFFMMPVMALAIIFGIIKRNEDYPTMKWYQDIIDNKIYNWMILTDNDLKGNEYVLEFHYSEKRYGVNAQYKGPNTLLLPGLYRKSSGEFKYYGSWN